MKELYKLMAKTAAMRDQCLQARDSMIKQKNTMHDCLQNELESYWRQAQRNIPGSDIAYMNLLRGRSLIS